MASAAKVIVCLSCSSSLTLRKCLAVFTYLYIQRSTLCWIFSQKVATRSLSRRSENRDGIFHVLYFHVKGPMSKHWKERHVVSFLRFHMLLKLSHWAFIVSLGEGVTGGGEFDCFYFWPNGHQTLNLNPSACSMTKPMQSVHFDSMIFLLCKSNHTLKFVISSPHNQTQGLLNAFITSWCHQSNVSSFCQISSCMHVFV